jgi:DNA-binding Lrp family transcriptional regulator
MMLKIDKLDKKILYELEANSRQPISKIARHVGTSKQVVNYRIERMKEEGIIESFTTVVDRQKIGLSCISMFVKLRGASSESEREIVSKVKSLPLTGWLGKTIGRWDLLLTFLLRDVYDINNAFQAIMPCFGQNISEHLILFDLSEYRNARKIIYEGPKGKPLFFVIGENRKVPIDEKDYELLRLLARDSRISILECSQKLDLSDKTVKRKIQDLQKTKVIQGFKLDVNYALLGYSFYICMFQLGDLSTEKKEKLISYLCWDPRVTTVIETPTDFVDADVYVKSIQELNTFISDIKNVFEDLIVKCDTIAVSDVYKSDFFPDLLETSMQGPQKPRLAN